jgi:hypothetical protein
MSTLLREYLVDRLTEAREHDALTRRRLQAGETMVEVPSTGKGVSTAYEQLRNAAENAEEHLLLQRAIKRFYRRTLFLPLRPHEKSAAVGQELIVELLQAGYLPNTRVSEAVRSAIDQLIMQAQAGYHQLVETGSVPREKLVDWVLAYLSVNTEQLLNPNTVPAAYTMFAYQYFLQAIPRATFADWPDDDDYGLCLYLATYQALRKTDVDVVRADLCQLYTVSPSERAPFIELNQKLDRLYSSELTTHLRRIVSLNGAPLRVLYSMIVNEPHVDRLLADRTVFLDHYRVAIEKTYAQAEARLNKGLVKSIVFIFITKTLIGLGLEVPYDILVHGAVMPVPLLVNLLFPPLYMASLRIGITLPPKHNTAALLHSIEAILYDERPKHIKLPRHRRVTPVRQLVYTVFFALPIALGIAALHALHFTVLQMVIFFVFFSTASSLGFRLSSQLRELEVARTSSGFFGSLIDFFYLPFIMMGQWLSRKYSRLNLVTRFLDIAIELPLKAVLRLARQWIRFLDERREELY